MAYVEIVVNILLLIASILLVVVVLIQDSKSAGLGGAFGSESTSFSGARGKKASREKQLQKITVILGIIVAVLAVIMILVPAMEKWFTPANDAATSMLSLFNGII